MQRCSECSSVHTHFLQLLFEDHEAFPGQPKHIVPPQCVQGLPRGLFQQGGSFPSFSRVTELLTLSLKETHFDVLCLQTPPLGHVNLTLHQFLTHELKILECLLLRPRITTFFQLKTMASSLEVSIFISATSHLAANRHSTC